MVLCSRGLRLAGPAETPGACREPQGLDQLVSLWPRAASGTLTLHALNLVHPGLCSESNALSSEFDFWPLASDFWYWGSWAPTQVCEVITIGPNPAEIIPAL